MLISYTWLKKYINLTLSPLELVNMLNIAGLPVEEIIEKQSPFTNVYVAKIIAIEKHPQADNLNLCDVTDGTETFKIVCGAKNVTVGQIIALAKIGAVLPGDFKIKKAKIRGIESSGMICSTTELGLSVEPDGIMVLDASKYKIGEAFEPIKPDTILNLEITPNRPDLLSLTGVARFIASRTGLQLNYPSCNIPSKLINPELLISSKVQIENLEPIKCPRYCARLIEGVKIAQSPQWLKDALSSVNIRPINNVVDITNYVLFELNHPLHAFDLKKLSNNKIIIRTAKAHEKILTLDGKEYHPNAEDLIIADSANPIALAGIMGGENYSVDNTTTSIVLESACFQPKTVRISSRHLGVSSDSSYRFERGIDIDNVANALNHAVELIVLTAGGIASADFIDIYPSHLAPKTIKVRFNRVNQILGTNFTAADIEAKINKLFFPIKTSAADSIIVEIPHYRVDITEEIDIIEDIAQISGYDNIPSTLPIASITLGRDTSESVFKRQLATVMTGFGFSEVINYSFLNNKLLKSLNAQSYLPANSVALKNAYNDEETHMKTSLLPDLIKNLITNFNNENANIHLFETANVFFQKGSDYLQLPRLAAITYGMIIDKAFNNKEFQSDFYYIKSVIRGISSTLGLNKDIQFKMSGSNEFYEYFAEVLIGNRIVGTVGQLKEEILYNHKLKEKAHMFELDIEALGSLNDASTKYSIVSRFPVVKRDISVVVSDTIEQEKLETIINSDYKSLIKSIRLFDLYKGNQIPNGCKSLSYNIIFQSDKKTLSEVEINKAMERITSRLKSELNAELRS
ncbi:MAG: phenylalanine--tRNA ligase subunit beta [bacterium]